MSDLNNYYAFAEGALTKLAEYNVSPADFINAAAQSRDPEAVKIAEAIVDYANASRDAGYTKTASVLQKIASPAAAPGMFGRAVGAIGDSFGALRNAPADLVRSAQGNLTRADEATLKGIIADLQQRGLSANDIADLLTDSEASQGLWHAQGKLTAGNRLRQAGGVLADAAPAAAITTGGLGLAGAGGLATYNALTGEPGMEVNSSYNPYLNRRR